MLQKAKNTWSLMRTFGTLEDKIMLREMQMFDT